MNDNDIIKVLEVCAGIKGTCSAYDCPAFGRISDHRICAMRLKRECYDLISRQKAEIERLTKENEQAIEKWHILEKRTKERYAELYEEAKEVVRAEAIKEFAEKLKESISNMEYRANVQRKTVSVETLYTQVNWVFHEIVPKTIDSLVKEMTEGKDGNV